MNGHEVRKLRERLGLTQTEMGKRLGVRWSTVSRWENGHTPVSEKVAMALTLLTYRHRLEASNPVAKAILKALRPLRAKKGGR